ncbi:hypothetical protein EJB05_30945, partial [Eragrostis curvula]
LRPTPLVACSTRGAPRAARLPCSPRAPASLLAAPRSSVRRALDAPALSSRSTATRATATKWKATRSTCSRATATRSSPVRRAPDSPPDPAPLLVEQQDWCEANLRQFFEIVKGEIDAGNRPLGQWTKTGWKNLVVKYHERTGLKQTKKQLKNKLDSMRKEYTWFMELKNCATGLGWNDAKQTVDCSKKWWDEHFAKCNNPEKGIKCNHVKFRKQGPKHLDDLHILFEKVLVTGASASCLGDISSDDSSDDDVAEVQKTPESDDVKLAELKKAKPGKKKRKDTSTATEEKDEKSPFLRMYKNTCMRIETAAEKIFTSASASSAPPKNEVPTIKEAMQMVKDCGVEEKTALMHTATFLIVKPEFREAFSSLQTNEGRFDLLEREHENEELKRK